MFTLYTLTQSVKCSSVILHDLILCVLGSIFQLRVFPAVNIHQGERDPKIYKVKRFEVDVTKRFNTDVKTLKGPNFL